MFELEDYKPQTDKNLGRADYLKLEEGKRIRNITLTGIAEGENQYGYYCIGFFKTDAGARGFVNLSPRLIKDFTVNSSTGLVLNPELRNRKIWIGKRSFINDAGERRSYLDWGFEE